MEAYAVLVESNFTVKPSQYLGLPEEMVDHDAERAFIIASINKHNEDLKKAAKKKH